MSTMSRITLFVYTTILVTIQSELYSSAAIGMANFTNASDIVTGMVTVHRNPVFGTFLVGQLQNITCQTPTSATKTSLPIGKPLVNNCMLGITVNNWKSMAAGLRMPGHLEVKFLQTIFNWSAIGMPSVQAILSGQYNPFPNLLPQTAVATPAPIDLSQVSDRSCDNVGEVYNPRNGSFSSPFGVWTAPGVMVMNGTGSVLMGPLEYLTAGPTSVVGLPLVLWMNAISPAVNGSANTTSTALRDRILSCAMLMPLSQASG